MKKVYEAPSVEKIAFMYRDQVVVASGLGGGQTQCTTTTIHIFNGDAEGVEACHIKKNCYDIVGSQHD